MAFDLTILEFDKIRQKIAAFAETTFGKDAVFSMAPSTNEATITSMLEETSEALMYVQEGLAPSFSGVYDLLDTLKRCRIQGVLSIGELLNVVATVDATKRIKRDMKKLSVLIEQPIAIESYAEMLSVHDSLRKAITHVINDHGEIVDSASDTLKRIRRERDVTEKRIKTTLEDLVRKYAKRLSEQLVTFRRDRYVIPVKATEKNTIKGTVVDYSASGETAYVEPDGVRTLTAKKLQLETEEQREIERLLYMLSSAVAEDSDSLEANQTVLKSLDHLFAKAHYAHTIEATKPEIGTSIHLIKARHPLIPSQEVVANTITFDDAIKAMLVTGSNTGGKTVTLKTVGLCALLMQSGCLLPVSLGSTMPVFRQVRADIGDEQSIEQSLSTFSSHMKNIVNMLNNLEAGALILLDELGVGTDPKEGAALAMSILSYLLKRDVTVMATTHYPELKAFAYSDEAIVNASVAFDEKSLQPTYRLLLRTPGESHAFLIAKRLGLNETIIDTAAANSHENKTEISRLIENLRKESKRLDAMIQKYERLIEENASLREDLEKHRRHVQKERETIKERLNKENQRAMVKLKEEASRLIHELESLKDKAVKPHELASLKYKIRQLGIESDSETPTASRALKKGDTVYIRKFNRYGELLKKRKDGSWEVKMGSLSSVFKDDALELAEKQKTDVKKQEHLPQSPKKSTPKPLDLRGMRVLEAKDALAKHLDDCAMASTPFTTIIHGFGTLALRKMVHETLASHPLIERYRDGEGNEGGKGVSVVYFK